MGKITPKEVPMNNLRFDATSSVVSGAAELVRGQEQSFLARMNPLVRNQSVCLDLGPTQRIDAAGVAALIQLYCAARDAGHGFAVSNPRPQVAEILALVGLDGILLSRNTEKCSLSGIDFERTAA
jgi:anti-anti-sigma regulatory factor